jgi:hypothetical protein
MCVTKVSRFSALAAVLVCASFAFSQQAVNPVIGNQEGSISKFIANLVADGFNVGQGSALQLDPGQLCCKGYLPSALFFNKAAPYVGIKLPPLEAPLPILQLQRDEAVVLIGVTPPAAQYFSYQLYLLERVYPPDTRVPIFASLGDTANLRTIKTVGPDPFNRRVVFIFTPDQGTEARVRAALQSAGYPTAIINTLVVPASMLTLGVDPKRSDVLLILHRMAMFTDPDGAGKNYLDAFNSNDPPLRAFRVTPKTSVALLHPFPTPPLRIRGTGRSEMDLTPTLARLRQAILDDNSGLVHTEYHTRPVAYDGYDYIQRAANAFGDNRDALYLGAGWLPDYDLNDEKQDTLTLRDDEFLIAYGPNHVATGKATYTNINAYASETATGSMPRLSLGSVFSNSFGRSAYPYLGQRDPAADLMYVYKIARYCNGEPFCLELQAPQPCTPSCGHPPPCPPFIFDSTTKLGVAFRNYLEPRTNVGPAFTEILYDQIIKFSH